MTEEQAWSYLAGLIDGEGCVYFNPKDLNRCLTISTTEEDLRDGCFEVLDFLDIRYKVSAQPRQKEHHAVCYDIRIHYFEGFLSVYENCPLRSRRKRSKLQQILLSYSRKSYTAVQPLKEGRIDA
jgi:hypothetical protein